MKDCCFFCSKEIITGKARTEQNPYEFHTDGCGVNENEFELVWVHEHSNQTMCDPETQPTKFNYPVRYAQPK